MTKSEAGMLGAAHAIKLREKREKEYLLNPKVCKNCDKFLSYKEILSKKVFCSRSCSVIYSNSRRKTKSNKSNCLICSKIFTNKRNTTNKFCSRLCHDRWKRENVYIPRVLNGEANKIAVKNYLMTKHDGLCDICKNTNEWCGKPLVFHMDHIDGNSDNNNISNVRLICPNCHSQTSTYGAKGRTKGIPVKNTKRNNYLRGNNK